MTSSLTSPHKMVPGQNGKAPTTAHMSNPSKIFEKKNAGIHHMRRSTPDSEALASSDDDHDQSAMSQSAHSIQSSQSATVPKPARRASWLSEVQAGSQQRKFSVGSATNVQPSSGPTTPASESGPTTGWGLGSGVMRTSPWSGAWQKEPPARLVEDVQTEGFTGRYFPDDDALVSPTSQRHPGDDHDGSFPFPIPMAPVRKNVRSQSYSVGQMEAEANLSGTSASTNPSAMPGYGRSGATGLPHRPSRPSMLGESGRPVLGQLLEDEDDHPHSPVSFTGTNLPRSNSGKSDQTSNTPHASSALLKQAAVENALAKQRSSTNIGFTSPADSFARYGNVSGSSLPSTTLGPAVEDNNEEQDFGGAGRGESKKALWQTQLGFGPVDDGSQSRRHSFADIPSRSRTVSSSLLSPRSQEGLTPTGTGQYDAAVVDDPLYFGGVVPHMRAQQLAAAEAQGSAVYRDAAHTSMNPFAVPPVITAPQPDIYIVTFKCARADVYYIPANTGLQVKVGDMVIVEGDRGLDLGTVSHARIAMAEAKHLRELALDHHFNWLMMFSRTMQSVTGTTPSSGLLAASNGDRPSAVGGMGPRVPLPAAPHISGSDHDLRPKLIRRLAQNHEIQMLRDKEGAEAKAKRVCQSKVQDHGLNMEILDAEFQFDWKKLTYFYFAETYVNFNELVTDLFKVYKTRIWMSAINPASFANATGGLGHPAGLTPTGGPQAMSPIGSRAPDRPIRPTSREPVVHGEETSRRFAPYPSMYGQVQAPPAMPYTTPWAAAAAAPMPPPNVAYGSPESPYGNYPSTIAPSSLTQFFGSYRPGPTATGGQPYTSEATVTPEDMAGQLQNLSLGAQHH